jgi:hypothetical protein
MHAVYQIVVYCLFCTWAMIAVGAVCFVDAMKVLVKRGVASSEKHVETGESFWEIGGEFHKGSLQDVWVELVKAVIAGGIAPDMLPTLITVFVMCFFQGRYTQWEGVLMKILGEMGVRAIVSSILCC